MSEIELRECQICGCRHVTEEKARIAWNTRPRQSELEDIVRGLVERGGKIMDCPQCMGRGSITMGNGDLDECRMCIGTKFNPMMSDLRCMDFQATLTRARKIVEG